MQKKGMSGFELDLKKLQIKKLSHFSKKPFSEINANYKKYRSMDVIPEL